ncbi:hypothetical protein D0962_25095 [Leptolyngbyaceae cyanobacterium CCMR0082]|uniref:Uncharacterized protein n=2 Tax=Adonisia TaxID=2950183 RepID=A0A6M0SBX2_9CYAN|nr:hypothetical protein [Adonisia turfae CCMR0082]
MSEKLIVQHIMKQIGATALKTILLFLGLSLWEASTTSVLAQIDHSGCYIQDRNGEFYDLSVLCTIPNDGNVAPVLQTGDVQVTLRWNTSDDLDLIVVDPAGSIVDFGSPTSPSGGQLDVDANGFCQTQNFSPVENIFWPTGSAPDGEYLAYVTLAIPCSLEDLASNDINAANIAYENLAVPYTLTILNDGVTTTYEGMSKPEGLGVDYPFQVGPVTGSNETDLGTDEAPKDDLELPNFGLPEL